MLKKKACFPLLLYLELLIPNFNILLYTRLTKKYIIADGNSMKVKRFLFSRKCKVQRYMYICVVVKHTLCKLTWKYFKLLLDFTIAN